MMRKIATRSRWAWAGLVCALAGCTGEIAGEYDRAEAAGEGGSGATGGAAGSSGSAASGGSGGRTGSVPPGSNPGGIELTCDETVPGPTPLTKLTTREYHNTVRDLLLATGFGDMPSAVLSRLDGVPDDSQGESFRTLDNRISLEHVQAYFDVGVAAGDMITADEAGLRSVGGGCAVSATLTEDCARNFIERFATRAYRSPLTDAEVDQLLALNDGQRTPAEALRAIVIVTMSSPRFVNHVEIDGAEVTGEDALLQLTSYEIASRLSYLFWQTMPDQALLDAAADGSLATEDGFAEQLDRVFRDDRTRQTLWQFWNEWLRLEKFTGFEHTRPGFQSLAEGEAIGEPGHDYYADMVQELRELTELFTFDRQATVADLLATKLSVTQSEDLAGLYGVEPWSGNGDYPELPDGERAGLLQRAALLVSSLETTNPFHRGAFVRRHLLCDPLLQPDPNTLPPGSLDPPPFDPQETTRERFQAKVEGNSTCQQCHVQFSDIGFVLEQFDALGRFRTTERVFDEQTGEQLAELPIEASGVTRIELDDADEVSSAAALNDKIIASKKVESCMAGKYFSFALRREPEDSSLDDCAIEDLASALDDPEAGLGDAFQRIARHPSFFVRKVGPQ
jgi:hypothetical protein